MISWQSIMSVFNTKGTLLKWLKTLDQSLKDGVLESVTVKSVSEGVIMLSFNFADGSTVTTPQIELPAGERGQQGIPGADGADGTDGTDGRDALVQNRALSSANITSPMAIPIEALNRTAVVGEPIVMFATDTTENKTYMLIGTVTNVGSPGTNPYVFVTYSNKIDITGPQGPPGVSPDVNVVENPILSLFTKDTATLNNSALGQEIYVEYYYLKENQNPVNIPITATLSFPDLEMNVPVTNVLELYAVLSFFGYAVAGDDRIPSTKVTGISGIQNTLVQNTTIVTSAFNVVSGGPDLEKPFFVANSFIMKKFPSSTFIDFQLDFGEYLVEIHLNSIEDTYLKISTIQMVAGNRTLPLPSPSTAGQVPVVNAAGNGYELQAQSSGGGSGIYKHYITDVEDRRATIFTNNGDVMTEWPTAGSGIIVVSLGQVKNGEGLGNILFLDSEGGDPLAPEYVYVTRGGSVSNEHFAEIQSDEVTAV